MTRQAKRPAAGKVTPFGQMILDAIRQRTDIASLTDASLKLGHGRDYMSSIIRGHFQPSPGTLSMIVEFLNLDMDASQTALGWKPHLNRTHADQIMEMVGRLDDPNQERVLDYVKTLLMRQNLEQQSG